MGIYFTKKQLAELFSDVITSAQKKSNLIYKDKRYDDSDPRHRKIFIAKEALEDSLDEELFNQFND